MPAINPATYHEANLRMTLAMGDKVNAGDATFEPVGFDGLYLLIKQFPHPKVGGGAEIEVPMAGGGTYFEQQPMETKFQSSLMFLETTAGTVQQFLRDVVAGGGFFDARIYDGTPQRHFRSYLLERCFCRVEPVDRDWENRSQVLQIAATLYGHYFGKETPGNI